MKPIAAFLSMLHRIAGTGRAVLAGVPGALVVAGCAVAPSAGLPTPEQPAGQIVPPSPDSVPARLRPAPGAGPSSDGFGTEPSQAPAPSPSLARPPQPALTLKPPAPSLALPGEESAGQETSRPGLRIGEGLASWYADRFHGRRTANGERYDQTGFTAAHRSLPFGTRVCVRSLVNGRTVQVRINDRGPFTPGRVIDVSRAAAEELGLTGLGIKPVELVQLREEEDSCPEGLDQPVVGAGLGLDEAVAAKAVRQAGAARKASVRPGGQRRAAKTRSPSRAGRK